MNWELEFLEFEWVLLEVEGFDDDVAEIAEHEAEDAARRRVEIAGEPQPLGSRRLRRTERNAGFGHAGILSRPIERVSWRYVLV